MIPDVPAVLNGIVRTIMMDPDAAAKTPYRAFNDQLLSVLLMMITQEFDRAAARLVEENQVLADLLRDALPIVQDAALRATVENATRGGDPGLLVSALRERNRALRGGLVRLHAAVEGLDTPAARACDERIWAELAASTRRRQLDLANG